MQKLDDLKLSIYKWDLQNRKHEKKAEIKQSTQTNEQKVPVIYL